MTDGEVVFKTLKIDYIKEKQVNGTNGEFTIWSVKSGDNWYDVVGELKNKKNNTLQGSDLIKDKSYKCGIVIDHQYNDKIIWIGEVFEENKQQSQNTQLDLSELNKQFAEFVEEYKTITLHPVLEDFILKYYEKSDNPKFSFLTKIFYKEIKK